MKHFNKILAVTHNIQAHYYVLQKALTLATKAGAQLTLLSSAEHKSSLERYINEKKLQHLLLAEQSDHTGLRSAGTDESVIEIKASANSCSYQGILQELARNEYDLLITAQQPCHQYLGLFLTDNGHLIRESGTNLLFVGKKKWPEHGRILTALETEESTRQHQSLNNSLLDESRYVAKLLASDMHLLNCYQADNSMSLAFVERQSMLDAQESQQEQTHDQYHQHLAHLYNSAKAYRLNNECLHVEQGLADYVIPHQAQKHDASIVVIGAGEHHGFVDAIKGHTAEYIIDQLGCDSLIFKANAGQIH